MKLRAKKDMILTSPSGKSTLTAWGDKVYVHQTFCQIEIYSYRSRECIATFTEMREVYDLFGSEEEFKKAHRGKRSTWLEKDDFKYEPPKNKLLALLILLLPLGLFAQVNSIRWACKAVRVDSNYVEFHLLANIARGYYIYAPNKPSECCYSPIITFNKAIKALRIGEIEVVESMGEVAQRNISTDSCAISRYSNSVIFMQLLKLPIQDSINIAGEIICPVISKYSHDPSKLFDFSVPIGGKAPDNKYVEAEDIPYTIIPCTGMVCHKDRGVFRRVKRFVRNVF